MLCRWYSCFVLASIAYMSVQSDYIFYFFPLIFILYIICRTNILYSYFQNFKLINKDQTLLLKCIECSPTAREIWVQSQVESYQRLKKWYLMPPCLALSIIRYGLRVKWSNPGKGVAPSPTPWCSKLSKREPSGHPRLWSTTYLLTILYLKYILTCI